MEGKISNYMPSNKKREQPQMKIRSPSFSCSSSASCTEPPPPPPPTVQPAKSKTKHTGRKINPQKPEFSAILGRKTSFYKGVTRHKWTGKFEAHIWDGNSPNPTPNRKGRQGGYDDEETAAHTHDLASLKYWGPDTILNFPLRIYIREFEEMQKVSKEEYIATLRRRSSGFSRGLSKYRGVARHHQNGRWEARIGCALGNKYLYLGTFSTQEEAAVAYDLAAIQFRGLNAVTNFHISNYIKTAQVEPLRHQLQLQQQQPTSFTESQHVIPSQFPNPKHLEPVDYHKSMVVDSFEEHPWNSFMDSGLNPLPVLDTAQSSELLDLFNDRGFEENIELLFEESKENENGLD